MPKLLTQFAPGGQQAHCFGVANDHRPDDSLGFIPLLAAIADPKLTPMRGFALCPARQ